MMKYTFSLLFLFIVWTSFGQNQTSPPQDNTSLGYTESQFKEAATTPIGMTRNVKQARNGDILIASFLGVFRYDGTSLPTGQAGFTNLTSKISSPRFSNFWDVLEDRKGNLWFGTNYSGVYCYNGKSFQHFTTKDGLASNSVTHIYEDKTGKLWFGAQGEDMFVYDAHLNGEVGQGKTFTVLKNKDGKAFNNVWSIIEDKKGNIWTTGRTLSRYDQKSLYDKNPTVTEIMSIGPMLLGISEANDGSIWFGSMVGVYRYDGKTITDVKGKEWYK